MEKHRCNDSGAAYASLNGARWTLIDRSRRPPALTQATSRITLTVVFRMRQRDGKASYYIFLLRSPSVDKIQKGVDAFDFAGSMSCKSVEVCIVSSHHAIAYQRTLLVHVMASFLRGQSLNLTASPHLATPGLWMRGQCTLDNGILDADGRH